MDESSFKELLRAIISNPKPSERFRSQFFGPPPELSDLNETVFPFLDSLFQVIGLYAYHPLPDAPAFVEDWQLAALRDLAIRGLLDEKDWPEDDIGMDPQAITKAHTLLQQWGFKELSPEGVEELLKELLQFHDDAPYKIRRDGWTSYLWGAFFAFQWHHPEEAKALLQGLAQDIVPSSTSVGRPRNELYDEAFRLYQEGYSITEIVEQVQEQTEEDVPPDKYQERVRKAIEYRKRQRRKGK